MRRWQTAWRRNSGTGIPFPRRKHSQLIQKHINPCNDVLLVLSLQGNPLEELW